MLPPESNPPVAGHSPHNYEQYEHKPQVRQDQRFSCFQIAMVMSFSASARSSSADNIGHALAAGCRNPGCQLGLKLNFAFCQYSNPLNRYLLALQW